MILNDDDKKHKTNLTSLSFDTNPICRMNEKKVGFCVVVALTLRHIHFSVTGMWPSSCDLLHILTGSHHI